MFASVGPSQSTGKILKITGYGAVISQTIVLTIFSDTDDEVVELRATTTSIGEFETFWSLPKDLSPGKYTIKAKDPKNEAEITFDY